MAIGRRALDLEIGFGYLTFLGHEGGVNGAHIRTRAALLAVVLGACESTADVLTRHVAVDASTSLHEASTSGTSSTSISSGFDSDGATGQTTGETDPARPACPPEVRVTEFDLEIEIIGDGGQRDTAPLPLALASNPVGGGHLAALGLDGQVHVVQLDRLDQPVGFASSFVANDLIDIMADDEGGVLAVTRDARGGGTLHCGDPAELCNPPADPIPCHDMVLVRFDRSGAEVWATPVTPTSEARPPYAVGAEPSSFIWWYQHHGRIASDGTHYALYFSQAIGRTIGACVDIFEGDRMQVVGPTGALVDHPDAFEIGCSQSWNTRMVWDDRTGHFVMVCATDNQARVARPAPYRTIVTATDLPTLSLGDLVLAPDAGYWASVSDQGTTRLVHFLEATPEIDLPATQADFSHLVALGPDLLLTWASDTGMSGQVHDARTGEAKTDVFGIDVPDHRYQVFEAYSDGSAAFAARGTTASSVRVARVYPCDG